MEPEKSDVEYTLKGTAVIVLVLPVVIPLTFSVIKMTGRFIVTIGGYNNRLLITLNKKEEERLIEIGKRVAENHSEWPEGKVAHCSMVDTVDDRLCYMVA